MLLETQTLGSWFFDVSAALVAGVVGGLIVIAIQAMASPRRAGAHSTVTSFTTIRTIVSAKQPTNNGNPVSVEVAVAGAVLGLILVFSYFAVVLGLTAGLLVGSIIAGVWSAIRTTRQHLWGMPTRVTAARLVIAFAAIIYGWASVLTFEHAGQTWESLMTAATGEGVGLPYIVSSASSFFAALTVDGFALATSILGTLAIASMLLGLSLATSFRWAAFLSLTNAPLKYFVQSRTRAAASILNTSPSYMLTESTGLLVIFFLSPPVFLPLMQSLQTVPAG